MAVEALIKTHLRPVDRGPVGVELGLAEGNINEAPILVTLTVGEIHIGWVDRSGPAFVIDLNVLVKTAITEIEAMLGIKKELR